MKKLINIIMLVAVLGLSSLSAKVQTNAITNANVAQVQQADVDFLFNGVDTSKVAVLSNEELDDTRGEFWLEFIFGSITLGIEIYKLGKSEGWW
ncbi:hypothetical protein DCO58_12360 [Helicobacter saguini]|uniref:Uncharacterized protein n=1 Tax=Helicobacter saguini TaxID=1548018 RepID=A0A099BHT6_9HELI|nr:hypothetical protein [Helicobacter saguini]MWV60917.1 hypothetical protein [Helicobacter saguini]MWV68415.1 hypothetical protein [Helicobacter saguini]MWV70121.1 hypothetical protein [Helicobacter saguini]MWV72024.1 hypothetical protein [Helicobacter saguini]TLD93752.1 hypothetical protein LS64_008135 [Helicobacter saguini]